MHGVSGEHGKGASHIVKDPRKAFRGSHACIEFKKNKGEKKQYQEKNAPLVE